MDPAAAAASGLVGSVIDSAASVINTRQTNKANRELAEYQYSKDLEMWHLGNQYNSPTAQMERLKAAGLNPNMIYGSGSSTGNTASQLPKYQAPRMEYNYQAPNALQVLDSYMDFRTRSAQQELLGAQAANVRQQEILNSARVGDTLSRTAKTRFDLGMAQMLKNFSLQAAQLGVARQAKQLDVMDMSMQKTSQGISESRQRMDWRSHDINRLMLDNQYRISGLSPNDPWYIRAFQRNILQPFKENPQSLKVLFKNMFGF